MGRMALGLGVCRPRKVSERDRAGPGRVGPEALSGNHPQCVSATSAGVTLTLPLWNQPGSFKRLCPDTGFPVRCWWEAPWWEPVFFHSEPWGFWEPNRPAGTYTWFPVCAQHLGAGAAEQ